MDGHSRGRASRRYQLEQYEVDWLLKRVRRFFNEGQQCPNNDIVVLEQQDYNRFRLAIFMKGEWIVAVYHKRYYVFVTFLPPEVLDDLTLPVTPDHAEVHGRNGVETPAEVQI